MWPHVTSGLFYKQFNAKEGGFSCAERRERSLRVAGRLLSAKASPRVARGGLGEFRLEGQARLLPL